MPKELIHFKIAERTATLLKDTKFAPYLEAQPQGLLLGSVFHDALFYGVTPSGRPLEKLSHTLHGADGQDTFTVLRLQAHHIMTSNDKALPTAMLVGMASHIFADIIMHPMVWYFSGNYYATNPKDKSYARQRHRALEALMDMIACPAMLGNSRYSIRRMLKTVNDGIETSLPIKDLAELASVSQEKARKGLRSAWRIFAGFYPAKPLARSLFAMRPWLPALTAEITTLFYAPQLMHQADTLNGKICFTHPVTENSTTTTIEELMETAAIQTDIFCRTLEAAIFDEAPLPLSSDGPSLDSGLTGIPTQQMRYYANPPFPELT